MLDTKALRKKLGLSQKEFWNAVSVHQSSGARYERGRHIPNATKAMIRLVHIEQVDVEKITKGDQLVAEYLKAEDPETYLSILKVAKAKLKQGE